MMKDMGGLCNKSEDNGMINDVPPLQTSRNLLQNQTLRISAGIDFPFVFEMTQDNTTLYTGVLLEMLNALSQHFGFQFLLNVTRNNDWNDLVMQVMISHSTLPTIYLTNEAVLNRATLV